LFFGLGALMSSIAAITLAFPGSFLQSVWRLNPRAYEALSDFGVAAAVMMAVVSLACASATLGLWRAHPWGRLLAIGLLTINALSDMGNAMFGDEPWAAIGAPIAVVLIAYLLSRRVRRYFAR